MDMTVFDGEFNLAGRSGQAIALVGPSGCGMLLLLLIFFLLHFFFRMRVLSLLIIMNF